MHNLRKDSGQKLVHKKKESPHRRKTTCRNMYTSSDVDFRISYRYYASVRSSLHQANPSLTPYRLLSRTTQQTLTLQTVTPLLAACLKSAITNSLQSPSPLTSRHKSFHPYASTIPTLSLSTPSGTFARRRTPALKASYEPATTGASSQIYGCGEPEE